MASERRIEKINILIKEELAKIIHKELEFPDGILVTITNVTASPDLETAIVHLSILGSDAQSALEILQKNIYHIQQRLNRTVRMRPVPKIRFLIDEGEEKREVVEKSLAELKKKGEI